MQDTGLKRVNVKDQYYTHPDIAQQCIQELLKHLPETRDSVWVEPSAGDGAFFHSIPYDIQKIGLDIDPKAPDILVQDFLSWNPTIEHQSNTPIVVIGNPPFGRQSSMAKAFIAKSVSFASVIAFILPRSFTKPSMFKVFPPLFHCLFSKEIPKHAFLLNGVPYDVPCVFQLWVKKHTPRQTEATVQPNGFAYVKVEFSYHFVVRRVGGLAGKAYKNNGHAYNPQTHYFIHLEKRYLGHLDTILTQLNTHVFPSNTVGPRSLSKTEVSQVLNAILVPFS